MLASRTTKCLGLFALGVSLLTRPAQVVGNELDGFERAILVLDASGSMWGQIDGTPKIAIAREVIDGLLQSWDPKVKLGVTAYGHREKGNCADIEALVPVGPTDRDNVMSAIDKLNPKGKTPLTDAVRQAAETLRYTEERATVILVSDGKETCNVDPCAAAAELEASGVDFTVHVIGFDLDADEKAQLQCLAETTSGRFLSANNASELHEAMATTVELVAEPEPKPKRVVKVASTGTVTAANATERVYVRLAGASGGSYIAEIGDGKPVQLKAGSYRLDGQKQTKLTQFDVAPGEDLTIDVNDFVGWASAVNATEKVYVRLAGASGGSYIAEIGDGKPVQLKAGSYRLDGQKQTKLTQFDVVPGEDLTIDVNDFVGWASAVNATEKVYVRLADASGGSYIAEIGDGKPVQLKAGSYRLDGQKQTKLTQFDIVPGEEVVIDFDG